jgi:putative hydrolases of HD superfamily
MHTDNLIKIIQFMKVVENLKSTIRFTKTRKKIEETTAAHTWGMALLFVLVQEELKLKVDILHALKIILVHDIGEAIIGDYDARTIATNARLRAKKEQTEKAAMVKLKNMLPTIS